MQLDIFQDIGDDFEPVTFPNKTEAAKQNIVPVPTVFLQYFNKDWEHYEGYPPTVEM